MKKMPKQWRLMNQSKRNRRNQHFLIVHVMFVIFCLQVSAWKLNSFFLEMNSLDYVLSLGMRCGNDEKHPGLPSWSIEAS
jgi:hypothetical protein